MGSRTLRPREIAPAASSRASFVMRVYLHLLGAIAAFVAWEVMLFESGAAARIARAMSSTPWPLVLGAFLLIAWFATRMAWRLTSTAGQYTGLVLYILAKGLIFVPLLHRAERFAPGTIEQAAQVTVLGALGLTLVAWTSRSDFAFLRSILYWCGTVALILIACAFVFGWHLGTWFSVAMIAFSGASILYDTAGIVRRYRQDGRRGPGSRHVGAALSLFASIGMMFWYVLRLTTRLQRS